MYSTTEEATNGKEGAGGHGMQPCACCAALAQLRMPWLEMHLSELAKQSFGNAQHSPIQEPPKHDCATAHNTAPSNTLFFKFSGKKQKNGQNKGHFASRLLSKLQANGNTAERQEDAKKPEAKHGKTKEQNDDGTFEAEPEEAIDADTEDTASNDSTKSNTNDVAWSEILHLPKAKRIWTGLPGIAVTLFGMLLPGFILFSSIASAPKRLALVLLHHPLETSIELLLIATIPVIHYLVWSAICKGRTNLSRWLVMALGAAAAGALTVAGICIAGLFSSSTDLANAIGTDFSTGFTWLALLCVMSSSVSAYLIKRLQLSWELPSTRLRIMTQALTGFFLSLLAFGSAEYHPWCIRLAQYQAVSVDEKVKTEGLRWLRTMNPEREMRMECSDSRAAGLAGLFLPIKNSEQQQLYFTLTGTPYSFRDMNATDLSSMSDDYLSRHVVGDRVPKLGLTRSNLSGILHPNTLTSTLYWTFVIKNSNSWDSEARAEIGLPPGAVINGLTVWHKGEPEEATFVASGKVAEAQTNVVGHDCPAMITDLGRGRALLHAYPVPREEELKIRVSMVVPLKADGDTQASLQAPKLIATNFDLKGEHHVRLRSEGELSRVPKSLELSVNPAGEKVLSGELTEQQLESHPVTLSVKRQPFNKPYAYFDKVALKLRQQDEAEKEAQRKAKAKAEAEAAAAEAEKAKNDGPREIVMLMDGSTTMKTQIEQLQKLFATQKTGAGKSAKKPVIKTIKPQYVVEGISRIEAAAPKQLVIVLDGSASIKKYIGEISKALHQLPKTIPASIIVASQEDAKLAKTELLSKRLPTLDKITFIGGQNNLKAVVKAAELAGETKGAAMLWIHGPQPVLNEEIYIMSPYAAAPAFYELSLGGETDTYEFFKNHAEIGPFTQVPRNSNNIGADLADFFAKWHPENNNYVVALSEATKKPVDCLTPTAEEGKELLALLGAEECSRLLSGHHYRKAARLAVAYQILSPVSTSLVSSTVNSEAADADDNPQANQNASNGENTDNSSNHDTFNPETNAPQLQGAVNGTIGPQGTDATIIYGVNTAGTVRVNNLANLEALLNIIANLGEIGCLIAGILLIIQGFVNKTVLRLGEDIELGPGGKIVLGVLTALIGFGLPGMINWFVASARDANLFS